MNEFQRFNLKSPGVPSHQNIFICCLACLYKKNGQIFQKTKLYNLDITQHSGRRDGQAILTLWDLDTMQSNQRHIITLLLSPVLSKFHVTVCLRSSYTFYIVSYNMKWVTTSWTHYTQMNMTFWTFCSLLTFMSILITRKEFCLKRLTTVEPRAPHPPYTTTLPADIFSTRRRGISHKQ